MRLGQRRVDLDGPSRICLRRVESRHRVFPPTGRHGTSVRDPGICGGERGVRRDRLVEEPDRDIQIRRRSLVPEEAPLQEEIVRLGVPRAGLGDPWPGIRIESDRQRIRDLLGQIVLDVEEVGRSSIVGLGPDVRSVVRIDQLRGHPETVRRAAHASLENRRDAQRIADRGRSEVGSLEREARSTGLHIQAFEPRQRMEKLFRQAIAEILVLRLAGHVHER